MANVRESHRKLGLDNLLECFRLSIFAGIGFLKMGEGGGLVYGGVNQTTCYIVQGQYCLSLSPFLFGFCFIDAF